MLNKIITSVLVIKIISLKKYKTYPSKRNQRFGAKMKENFGDHFNLQSIIPSLSEIIIHRSLNCRNTRNKQNYYARGDKLT